MQEHAPGIVLLAHGSRDARWREPVEAVARRVAERAPGALVRCAYLELSQPDLRSAMAELVAAGAGSVRVVPLFLGMGKHLREDLPGLLDELRALHPQVPVQLARAVGEEPEVLDLLARLALKT
ncbi:CbiX/SirB N-terminal domain-containing protein [Variovorax guangxiensis]|uniref:sirohydrochlorin chelatase n=1 Tax=Variovorax guangxiensis TaxID=1775474 RepID=UPI002866E062|nr:CbiX/SirB N-terminal domain-containing protein [Variovorax guangxiensis]MDR6855339.1 sirohydrochlorin cobaltochelatase [Variovorax guangxiensis]